MAPEKNRCKVQIIYPLKTDVADYPCWRSSRFVQTPNMVYITFIQLHFCPFMPLSDEDKALFNETMKTVKPLRNTIQRAPKPAVVSNIVRRKPDHIDAPKTDYYLSNYYTDIVTPTATLSFCNRDLPRKRLRELKNGEIRWEGRLDLHGLRPDAAREALCEFINRQYIAGQRCLLIIHGKGGRHDEEPILKNHVNHWLQQLPQVLAFHSAIPRDGGTGAVYVLLKRQRDS